MENKKKTGFFTALISELKDFLKNPKKLIPTFVLCGIWLIFSLMSGFGINIPVLRFFYTLTYANGGMFGGFFGTVGGIFGKAVFAAVVNTIVLSICEKKNPFSGLRNGLKGIFAGGLFAAAPLLIGGGLGVLLYWFFNITILLIVFINCFCFDISFYHNNIIYFRSSSINCSYCNTN